METSRRSRDLPGRRSLQPHRAPRPLGPHPARAPPERREPVRGRTCSTGGSRSAAPIVIPDRALSDRRAVQAAALFGFDAIPPAVARSPPPILPQSSPKGVSRDEDRAYDPQSVEARWQECWEKERHERAGSRRRERPFYNLMMFPYPSAEGLHVGNVFAFTGSDIQGRFHRMRGHDGLRADRLRRVRDPQRELRAEDRDASCASSSPRTSRTSAGSCGGWGSWSTGRARRSTTDPRYYRWTQWIFLKLFEKRARLSREGPGQLVPRMQDGPGRRAGDRRDVRAPPRNAVEQRDTEQWFFRITAYAQRLLDNLATDRLVRDDPARAD